MRLYRGATALLEVDTIKGKIKLKIGDKRDLLNLTQMMPVLVNGDDVRSGRKAKARHGQLRAVQASMG